MKQKTIKNQPRTIKTFTIAFDVDLFQALKEAANKENRPIGAYVRLLIIKELKSLKAKS